MKKKQSRSHPVSFETQVTRPSIKEIDSRDHVPVGRRSFLKGLGMAGASLVPATALLLAEGKAQDNEFRRRFRRGLTKGDVDILRFLAAAEILETDLWVQYQELADNNETFREALEVLEEDMVQYIDDNTDDEDSHQAFLNAFLASVGAEPVNLDKFRTLTGSQATGVDQTKINKRLTNLLHLTVDTSWYTRYRSTENPDFGAAFTGPVTIIDKRGIPLDDSDLTPNDHIQAIANTAAFHFATIEQGGSSLYASLIPQATSKVVLRILAAIGGSEVAHFQTWHDTAGNAPPLTDPKTGLTFPDLNSPPFGGEAFETDLIMPEPCDFISKDLPDCSIIRPTLRKNAGPVAVANFLIKMGLFAGQSPEFFTTLNDLAKKADNARRQLGQGKKEEEEDDAVEEV
jgi:hypothetical protein